MSRRRACDVADGKRSIIRLKTRTINARYKIESTDFSYLLKLSFMIGRASYCSLDRFLSMCFVAKAHRILCYGNICALALLCLLFQYSNFKNFNIYLDRGVMVMIRPQFNFIQLFYHKYHFVS